MVKQLLSGKKGRVLQRWRSELVATYPAETASFLESEKDAFLNPVGEAIGRAGEVLFETARQGMEREAIEEGLGQLVRMRAVQGFSASRALSFLFMMKRIIRDEMVAAAMEKAAFRDMMDVESRLDDAVMVATDLYCACRQQIDEIRVKEVKAEKERLMKLLKAMNRGAGAAQ